ncbi:MAG: hypothetical protein WKF77_31425 [Planctomycetaceae bacterium]
MAMRYGRKFDGDGTDEIAFAGQRYTAEVWRQCLSATNKEHSLEKAHSGRRRNGGRSSWQISQATGVSIVAGGRATHNVKLYVNKAPTR